MNWFWTFVLVILFMALTADCWGQTDLKNDHRWHVRADGAAVICDYVKPGTNAQRAGLLVFCVILPAYPDKFGIARR